jgi:hypothetical protein
VSATDNNPHVRRGTTGPQLSAALRRAQFTADWNFRPKVPCAIFSSGAPISRVRACAIVPMPQCSGATADSLTLGCSSLENNARRAGSSSRLRSHLRSMSLRARAPGIVHSAGERFRPSRSDAALTLSSRGRLAVLVAVAGCQSACHSSAASARDIRLDPPLKRQGRGHRFSSRKDGRQLLRRAEPAPRMTRKVYVGSLLGFARSPIPTPAMGKERPRPSVHARQAVNTLWRTSASTWEKGRSGLT